MFSGLKSVAVKLAIFWRSLAQAGDGQKSGWRGVVICRGTADYATKDGQSGAILGGWTANKRAIFCRITGNVGDRVRSSREIFFSGVREGRE